MQRIVIIAVKVRRYQERVDSFRQNRTFQVNQRQFYRKLNQERKKNMMMIIQMLRNRKSFGETYGVGR